MDTESFVIIGVGTVTENKPHGDWYAEIFLLEKAQLAEEEVNSKDKNIYTLNLPNGTKKQISLENNNKVKAKWLNLGHPDRLTPPDLTINQHVLVYQKPGYDEYYWIKLFSEKELNLQEEVTYGWMARNESDKAEVDPGYLEHMYLLALSTLKGQITFRTTDANNEKSTYKFMMDTKEGKVSLQDKQNNFFLWNSVDGIYQSNIIKEKNTRLGETRNQYNGKDYNLKIEGMNNLYIGSTTNYNFLKDFNFKLDGNYGLDLTKDYNLKALGSIQMKSMKDMVLQPNQDFAVVSSGGEIQLVSSKSISIVAPTINLVGNVQTPSLACGALAVGGAAPVPPALKLPNIPELQMNEFDKSMEKLEEVTKVEEEDSKEEGSGQPSGKEEDKEDPWKNEQQPQEPEKPQEPSESKSTFEKPATFEASSTLDIKAQSELNMSSQASAKLSGTTTLIEGTGGLSLKGGGMDITDLLSAIIDGLCLAIDMPHATPAGPSVPPMAGTAAKESLKSLLTAFKGAASFSVSEKGRRMRRAALGIPEQTEQVNPKIQEAIYNINKALEEFKTMMNDNQQEDEQ